jgi:hypothetical protein
MQCLFDAHCTQMCIVLQACTCEKMRHRCHACPLLQDVSDIAQIYLLYSTSICKFWLVVRIQVSLKVTYIQQQLQHVQRCGNIVHPARVGACPGCAQASDGCTCMAVLMRGFASSQVPCEGQRFMGSPFQ